jgi:BASS family bile acid:Na+ symporter
MSKMLGGNAVLTLKVFIISHVIACFSIPGVIGLLTHSEIPIAQGAKQIFDTIQPLITIPLALAFGLRALYPRLSDKIVELQEYTFALWGASVMLILSKASHDVRQMGAGELWESGSLQQMAFVSLFLCLLLYTLGWLWERKSYPIEGAQSMGQKNTLLVIWISQLYVGPIATLGPVFYVVWQNILLSWLLYKSKKRTLFQSSGKGPRV